MKWDGYRCTAMKDGSRVTLHSRPATHSTNVRVTVEDDGAGFDPKVMEREARLGRSGKAGAG
jgi:signal transduction histidine kinase